MYDHLHQMIYAVIILCQQKLVWAILFSHFRWQSGGKTRFSRKHRFIELRSRENRVK